MKAKGLNQHQQSQSNTNLSSGWLQRAGVREVPGKEVETPAVESGLNRSFVNVPVRGGGLPVVQRKLTIGVAGDRYEREADRVASQVVQQINTPASVRATQGESVQRTEAPEEEEIQTKSEITSLQRQEASADLTSAINSARGNGQALDPGLQAQMGQAMGADFSRVRVHTDSQSDRLNQSIQAKAFTTGQDVFFRQGEYQPGSRGGQELIAHELTHVVQQGGAEKTIVQRKYDKEKLETTIKRVYSSIGKDAKEKDFVEALKEFAEESEETTEEIFGDEEFSWHLMKLVGDESGMKLHENIKESSMNKGKPILYKNTPVYQANWTLRTYTMSKGKDDKPVTPSYNDLKPTAELLVSGIKEKSDNTNDADWNKIGNVGFTFHLLCIDGNVPKRTFLDKCTHYAEFPMSTIPSMFVSGDMLGTTGNSEENKHGGFKGSGEEVKAALCSLTLDKSNAVKFLSGIDSVFGNFEVKVPGQLKVTEWKRNDSSTVRSPSPRKLA